MSVLSPKPIQPVYHTLERLTLQEIEQQLDSLPREIVTSINKTKATAYVLNVLDPLNHWVGKDHQGHPHQTHKILQEMISEAVTLALLRFLCVPSETGSDLC